jgi:protein required for attachment to host cells
MLSHNALVVVADGHQATLFRNVAKHGIELNATERLAPKDLSDQSPGVMLEDTTPRSEDESSFAIQLTDHLNALVLQHKADDVAVIADPTTLGVMRKRYHKELQLRIRKEIAKTMTNSEISEIENALH